MGIVEVDVFDVYGYEFFVVEWFEEVGWFDVVWGVVVE